MSNWLVLVRIVLALTLNYHVVNCGSVDPLVVTTNYGRVRGIEYLSANGKVLNAFLGLPYAKPPLKDLRFRHPVPPDPWTGILDANETSSSCPQMIFPFMRHVPEMSKWISNGRLSEDCLYLNVWVPKPRVSNRPVMVFIHGGGFSMGSVSIPVYSASILASEEDVIVVAMTYRLASLGFLFLEHPEVPGNAGLMDQAMALRWVKDNIEYFGGNSKDITLFGQSAGGVSVGFALMSPLTQHLVSKAIMESGSPTSEWPIQTKEENRRFGMQMAEYVGCKSDNVSEVVNCLRKVNYMDLINNEPVRGFDIAIFRPIIDNYYLPDEPSKLLKKKRLKFTPILVGNTRNEGTNFLAAIVPEAFSYVNQDIKINRDDFKVAVRETLRYESNLVLKAVEYEYTNWFNPEDPEENLNSADKVFGDYYFNCGIKDMAKAYAQERQPVYSYYFTHRSSNSLSPKWIGTPHGEELFYVFGQPLNPKKGYSEDERILSQRVMRYWANFARTGNPNISPDGTLTSIRWPKFTAKHQEYLVLAPNSTAVGQKFRERTCMFWSELLPVLVNSVNHR